MRIFDLNSFYILVKCIGKASFELIMIQSTYSFRKTNAKRLDSNCR